MAVPEDSKKPEAEVKDGKKKKDEPQPEELSEEDKALKESLELCVQRVNEPDAGACFP